MDYHKIPGRNLNQNHVFFRILRDKNLYSMRIALLGPRIRRTLYKPEKKKGINVQSAVATAVSQQSYNQSFYPQNIQQNHNQQQQRAFYSNLQNQQILSYIQAITQAHNGQLPPHILQQILKNPQCVAALLQQQQMARQNQQAEAFMQNLMQEQMRYQYQPDFTRPALSSADGSSSESGVVVNKTVKPPEFLCNLLDNIISDNEVDSKTRSRLASQVSNSNVQQQLSSIFDSPMISDAVRKASESQDFASASIWGYQENKTLENNSNSIWANSGKDNSVW